MVNPSVLYIWTIINMYFALFWTFVYSYVYICNPAATLNESIKM